MNHWSALSLTARFAATASLVVLVSMVALGFWVNDRIKSGVIQNSAANAALYLVGLVEPHVQELGATDRLPAQSIERLDQIYRQFSERRRVVALKVWARGGGLAYSSERLLIGQVYPESPKLKSAWLGNVEPEYDDLSHDENVMERSLGQPILEVYAPIRAVGGSEVIAVAEIYEVATGLARELRTTFLQTVLAMAGITALILGSLLQIVHRGSRTIERQQKALADRVTELSSTLTANSDLQGRLADANRRAAVANEQYLRKIGADLHDGPAQLIGYSLLRLDALRPRLTAAAGSTRNDTRETDDIDVIEGALRDGLRDLRAICADMAIPELQGVDLIGALRVAIRNHEHRTNTAVEFKVSHLPICDVGMPITTCLYRFVQEGLNNAYRHADGVGQRVEARCRGGWLEVIVSDRGPGMAELDRTTLESGLGLRGIKERVLATGGEFEHCSEPRQGTRLTVRFSLEYLPPSRGSQS